MRQRLSRRLAGCIAIELLAAANFQYKAGTAFTDHAKAIAIEDRRGVRVVIAEADFPVTRAISDFVSARLIETFGLERGGILLRGAGTGEVRREDLITAVSAALGKLEPATIRYRETISVTAPDGRCLAAVGVDGAVHLDGCGDGAVLHGPIRAAFQMVEPEHPLLARTQMAPSYPVQAIAIGKLTILAMPGAYPSHPRDVMLIPAANDVAVPPDSPAIDTAIRRVMSRVR